MKKEIPKVIHYCWFGGGELPELAVKCIESWKKYCPDYEIKEWNESNYNLNKCDYVKEAYESKKWAFVSDYARFDILYENGGLYFDTDVELISPIDDIIETGAFMGIERGFVKNADASKELTVNPGLGIGVEPHNSFFKEVIDYYNEMHFLKDNGDINTVTVVYHTTGLLKKYGFRQEEGIQFVRGIYLYPKEYFCPIDYKTGILTITENTKSIHHYCQSWLSDSDKKWHRRKQKHIKIWGPKKGEIVYRIHSFPHRVRKKIREIGFWNSVKIIVKKTHKK